MLHRVAGVELRQGLGSVGGQGHPQALEQVATRHMGARKPGSAGREAKAGVPDRDQNWAGQPRKERDLLTV